jgi:hypothetical protein
MTQPPIFEYELPILKLSYEEREIPHATIPLIHPTPIP